MRAQSIIFKALKHHWGDDTGSMSLDPDSHAGRAYWVAANVCAFVVGIGVRLALKHPVPNPILDHPERFGAVASRLGHYLFHPVTYIGVVVLFVFRVVQLKFSGFQSVLFSFIVGGISATIVLSLW